jgi:hypothetical protein
MNESNIQIEKQNSHPFETYTEKSKSFYSDDSNVLLEPKNVNQF